VPATDRLLELARAHGWTVDDRRAAGLAYFTRGVEYAHLGTDAKGDRVLSAYGGVNGRPSAHWVAGRSLGLAEPTPERGEELAARLTSEPYVTNNREDEHSQ
jgi:hypothetical protein